MLSFSEATHAALHQWSPEASFPFVPGHRFLYAPRFLLLDFTRSSLIGILRLTEVRAGGRIIAGFGESMGGQNSEAVIVQETAMNEQRPGGSMACAIVGLFAGLWWVDLCCRHDPWLHRIVGIGWSCAFQSLIIVVLGAVGLVSVMSAQVRRRYRNQIAFICALVMILGACGILYGLGFVLIICLGGCYVGEAWGYWSLIGWLIFAFSAVSIASTRLAPE